MKISKERLKQIIKEELEGILYEQRPAGLGDRARGALSDMDDMFKNEPKPQTSRPAPSRQPQQAPAPAEPQAAAFAVTDKASALKFLPLYLKSLKAPKNRQGMRLRSKLLSDHDVYDVSRLKDKMGNVAGYKFNGHMALMRDL